MRGALAGLLAASLFLALAAVATADSDPSQPGTFHCYNLVTEGKALVCAEGCVDHVSYWVTQLNLAALGYPPCLFHA